MSTNAVATAVPALAVLAAPESAEAEAFRALRANIKFAGGEDPPRVILLADTGAGPTRPTVAANLAAALALAGDATLLIDADLRQPSLHRLFGTANDAGLATYLAGGRGGALPTVATGVPNLDLLPAGPTPPNPAELLAANGFRAALAAAREGATFVIIDAPPVTTLADALSIAAVADGTLLIVRAGHTRRPAAQRAKEQLERVGANLLGVILTDAKG
ncbi:MAG TPA: CpsD/CapB family tyrosine-protein kinase [Thermomicrobiales bacterium]